MAEEFILLAVRLVIIGLLKKGGNVARRRIKMTEAITLTGTLVRFIPIET